MTLGQASIGTTTLNGTTTLSGTTSVATLNAIGATAGMTVGANLTGGGIAIANGAGFTGGIAIGAGSLVRTGTINIGTGGSGAITIGNSTCLVNAYNLCLDGSAQRQPRLIARGSVVISSIPGGSSNHGIASITIPGGVNSFELIAIVWNGDQFVQSNMLVSSGGVRTDGQLVAQVAVASAGAARISYAVYAP